MAKRRWPSSSGRKSSSDSTGFFQSSKNSYVSDRYAQELAESLGVDIKDKRALATVKENIEKIVDNLTDTSSEYQDMLKTLTAELNKYQSKGAKFQPKHMKELLSLQSNLTEVSATIRALGQGNKVSESSIAALSPLMLRVAQSVTELKSGAYGDIALKKIFDEKGLGDKTDVSGIDKLYKNNTDLLRRDYKDWMRNHSRLLEIGVHKGLTKATLAMFLGPASPLADVLNDTLQLDKRLAEKTEKFWRWSKGQSDKDVDNAIKQTAALEKTAHVSALQAEATQDFKDETNRKADIEATSAAAHMKASIDERNQRTKTEKQQTKLLKNIEEGIQDMKQWGLVSTVANLALKGALIALPGLLGYQLGKLFNERLDKIFPKSKTEREVDRAINEGILDAQTMFETRSLSSDLYSKGTNLADIYENVGKRYGVSPSFLASLAGSESSGGLNPTRQKEIDTNLSKEGLQGVQGLFSMQPETYVGMRRNHPTKFGPASLGTKGIMNPLTQAEMTAQLALENAERLRKNGLSVDDFSLKVMHMLPPSDGIRFLKAVKSDPSGRVVMPENIMKSNPEFFYTGESYPNGKPKRRTNVEVFGKYIESMSSEDWYSRARGTTIQYKDNEIRATSNSVTPSGVQRAEPMTMPAPSAPSQNSTTTVPAPQPQVFNDINIDKIPMVVDDAGLVLLTTGGLV